MKRIDGIKDLEKYGIDALTGESDAHIGPFLRGVVDNPLVEARLHGLNEGDEIDFHEDHVLAVHDIHRLEFVAGMHEADLRELAQWLSRTIRE